MKITEVVNDKGHVLREGMRVIIASEANKAEEESSEVRIGVIQSFEVAMTLSVIPTAHVYIQFVRHGNKETWLIDDIVPYGEKECAEAKQTDPSTSKEAESLLKRAYVLLAANGTIKTEAVEKWCVDYALMNGTPIVERGNNLGVSGHYGVRGDIMKEMVSCLLMSYSYFNNRKDTGMSWLRISNLIEAMGGMEEMCRLSETPIIGEMSDDDLLNLGERDIVRKRHGMQAYADAKKALDPTAKEVADFNKKVDQVNSMPIGVMPRYLHDEQRQKSLASAITRYAKDGRKVSNEWIEEFNELCNRINPSKNKDFKL